MARSKVYCVSAVWHLRVENRGRMFFSHSLISIFFNLSKKKKKGGRGAKRKKQCDL
jgi:hypothetical protein